MAPGTPWRACVHLHYFDDSSKRAPADAGHEFTVNTRADQASDNTAPLKVTEANAWCDAIVGAAVNGTGESAERPVSAGSGSRS